MKNIPEELIPLLDWWDQNGKQAVTILLVVVIAVTSFYGVKSWRANRRAAASNALMESYTTTELEDSVAKYEGMAAGPALKLRLAKKYYDEERYQEALDLYNQLMGAAPDGLADVPVVGAAQCLEALGKYEEAFQAYETFVAENPTSFLNLAAKLGAARTLALKGDKAGAVARLEALKGDVKDDVTAIAAVDAVLSAVQYQNAQ